MGQLNDNTVKYVVGSDPQYKYVNYDDLVKNPNFNNNINNITSNNNSNLNNNNDKSVIKYVDAMVGNFEYHYNQLKLGDLKGNKFTLRLRNVRNITRNTNTNTNDSMNNDSNPTDSTTSVLTLSTEERTALLHACEGVQKHGFINYFGSQRFGQSIGSHVVGRAILQGNHKLAIELLLMPREGERSSISTARKDILINQWDIPKFLRILPPFCVAERAVLMNFLQYGPKGYVNAWENIPKMLRMLMLHAYQSYVWNMAASARFDPIAMEKSREELLKPIVGDFVVVSSNSNNTNNTSTSTTNDNVNDNNTTSNDGGEGEEEEKDDGDEKESKIQVDDEPDSDLTYNANIHIVTVDDVANQRFTLENVVLPLVGGRVSLPPNKVGNIMEQILKRDHLSMSTFTTHDQQECRLPGGYRYLVLKPNNMKYWLEDEDDAIERDKRKWAAIDAARSLKSRGEHITREELERASAVATGALPLSDVENKDEFSGPNDGGSSNNNNNNFTMTDSTSSTTSVNSRDPTTALPPLRKTTSLVLMFELNRATYATMMIREVLKSSASSFRTSQAQHEMEKARENWRGKSRGNEKEGEMIEKSNDSIDMYVDGMGDEKEEGVVNTDDENEEEEIGRKRKERGDSYNHNNNNEVGDGDLPNEGLDDAGHISKKAKTE